MRLKKRLRAVVSERRGARDGESLLGISSFPFVSGDTFRLFAGIEIELGGLRSRFPLPSGVLFASAATASHPSFRRLIDRFLSERSPNSTSLLIHNGDKPPPEDELHRLAEDFEISVFCVNAVKESTRLRALPIGLENVDLQGAGKLKYFLDFPDNRSPAARNRLVMTSFHVSTNPVQRSPLAASLAKSRHGFDGVRWKRGDYFRELGRTLFVLSPPGNGYDCHRTWEAIAHGAVPVVLRGYLAPSLAESMPILAVDSWDDFIQMTDSELRAKYAEVSRMEPDVLLASYWAKVLG